MSEYIYANLWQLWAVLSVVCLIVELFTGGFFIICFAFGAIFSVVAALLGMGLYAQLTLFVLCSLASLFLVRPVAVRYLHRNDKERISNADAIIGRTGTVSEDIPAGGYGRVALDGDDWKAQLPQGIGATIVKGERVRIIARDSIIVTVEPLHE